MHTRLENVYVHVDASGRIYFDACKTDEEHLLSKATHLEQPLHRCRVYMKDLLPPDSIGKKGTLKLSIEFKPEEA